MDEPKESADDIKMDKVYGSQDDLNLEDTNSTQNVKIMDETNSTQNVTNMDEPELNSDLLLDMSHIVYLDKSMLSCMDGNTENKPSIDKENEDVLKETSPVEEVVEYEVYAQRMENTDSDLYDSDSSDSSEVIHEVFLNTTLKKIQDGWIINDTVYLDSAYWNTIKGSEESMEFCVLCDLILDMQWEKHAETQGHLKNMARYRPLKGYGLNLVRRIRGNYHCAVCNDIFTEDEEHISSEHHQNQLIEAISKVDVLLIFESNLDENDDENATNNNYIQHNDYNIQHNDCNIQNNDSPKSISYASIARKPKIIETEFVTVTLANKNVKVRFDSWHMILSVKNNYHCMACNKTEHKMLKKSHCKEHDHLMKLKGCVVVENFKEHLVRQVNDNFYHCAHCNNLQYKHDMAIHIECVHPKKNKSSSCENSPPDIQNNDSKTTPTHDPNKETTNESQSLNNIHYNDIPNDDIVQSLPSATMSNDNNDLDADLRDMAVDINIYGYVFKVPLLSFHILNRRQNDFYCGLCQMTLHKIELISHINGIPHLQFMQITPFLVQFGCHLIRSVRDKFHCAICNVPVAHNMIYYHLKEVGHIENFAKATNAPITNPWPNIPANPVRPSLLGPYPIENQMPLAPVIPQIMPQTRPNSVPQSPKSDNSPFSKPSVIKSAFESASTAVRSATNAVEKAASIVRNANDVVLKTAAIQTTSPEASPKITKQDIKGTSNSLKQNYEHADESANVLKTADQSAKENAISADEKTKQLTTADGSAKEIKTADESAKSNVRKKSADSTPVDLNISSELDESFETFNLEECIYLKLKNMYFRVTNSAFNSLVPIDNGRFCFVCDVNVKFEELVLHVDSRQHVENIGKCHFIDKYEKHLLRQMYIIYHCALCNVLFPKKFMQTHFDWPAHITQLNANQNAKRIRRKELSSGKTERSIKTQKEIIYLNGTEHKSKVILNVKIVADNLKMNKLVMVEKNAFKFDFDSWHSLVDETFGHKCLLCDCMVANSDVYIHVNTETHTSKLDVFEAFYLPTLIRPINTNLVNCVVCNAEVPNKRPIIETHVTGKKHKKNHKKVVKNSAENLENCQTDVLTLVK